MFEKIVSKFIQVASPVLFKTLILDVGKTLNVTSLKQKKGVLHHPHALYATDVMFQQTDNPCGNTMETGPYFSAKHKVHGSKTKASVLPMVFVSACQNMEKKVDSDISISRRCLLKHKLLSRKKDEADGFTDVDEDAFNWAMLADKRYQRAQSYIRAILRKKNPSFGNLTSKEKWKNKKIGADRVIVETFFGRRSTLWAMLSNLYKEKGELYGDIFMFCVALTNHRTLINLVRAGDTSKYALHRKQLYRNGILRIQKKAERQKQLCELRVASLAIAEDENVQTIEKSIHVPRLCCI